MASARGDKVDVYLLIDNSGGMASEIAEVKLALPAVHSDLTGTFGHDVQWGLAKFVENGVLLQDITDFATFNAPGGALDSLTNDGAGTLEQGYRAVNQTLPAVSFRNGAHPFMFVVTDEVDSSTAPEIAATVSLLAPGGAPSTWVFAGSGGDSSRAIQCSYLQMMNANSWSLDPLTGHKRFPNLPPACCCSAAWAWQSSAEPFGAGAASSL